jgi:Glycosyl transferase family 2
VSLELSYVVVTDRFETIRDVVRAVAAQTISDSVELVIVCPSQRELAIDIAETAGIGQVLVVEFSPVVPLSSARNAGIRACSCPLVFVGETHSYPAPNCLAALLAAHRSGSYVVVSPVIENGNPVKALSWASLMLTYRHWLEPVERCEIGMVSTYNACFRRAALLEQGDDLARLLDYGSGLDVRLRASGGRFLIEPAARLAHLNIAAWRGWLPDRFLSGRFWASARSRDWPVSRKLLYFVAAPLLPAFIAGRALRSPQWAHHRARLPRGTLSLVVLGGIITAAGEAIGYVRGKGTSPARLAPYELHRTDYL